MGAHPDDASETSEARRAGVEARREGLRAFGAPPDPNRRTSSRPGPETTRPVADATEEHDAMGCDETRHDALLVG